MSLPAREVQPDKYYHDRRINEGGFEAVPDYITQNLRHELRPYQTEAIGRYFHYYDVNPSRDRSRGLQTLFNMATGSGKTMIMAGLMLDLYKRGFNKVIFFVRTNNIVEKTRENFLTQNSSKYLFADKIVIDGKLVEIREVSDFSDARDDAINIVFTTTSGLHGNLKTPRENGLTYDDLAEHEVILLADEAHNLSGDTKSLTKEEKENDSSWEKTISKVQENNPKNILLEFTATIDLEDADIFYKYKDRIIYRYDLKAFREDGYSKDVWIHEVAAETMDRALQAMIISQYRKKIALSSGVWLKPVVMFKSRLVIDSNSFFDEFKVKVHSLNAKDLEKQRNNAEGILNSAFEYFDKEQLSMADLSDELRYDFAEERLISVAKGTVTPEEQRQLNTLEDKDNEIRAVFAVDVLNEGWDVLNLFDIVRLYDTRDSKNGKVGKTTNAEAQLIGRGARYYPFVTEGTGEEMRYTRKFDDNELEPLRVIEQLHYHSASNPRYIQEMRQTLREKGILADEGVIRRRLELKPEFTTTTIYQTGKLWKNERIVKKPVVLSQSTLFGSDEYNLRPIYEVELPSHLSRDIQVFGSTTEQQTTESYVVKFKFLDIPSNIVRHAADKNKKLRYDIVSKKIEGIGSLEAFLTDKSKLGGVEIQATSTRNIKRANNLTPDECLFIAEHVLEDVAADMSLTDTEYEGTHEFVPYNISDIFDKKIERNYFVRGNGDAEFGLSQSNLVDEAGYKTNFHIDLNREDWHAYNDNFGTSEEKQLVLLIKKLIDDLRQKWTDVYLIRNEGGFKIYDFDTGAAFEPDYVLIANDNRNIGVSWQIFIEPKGGHIALMDDWKQKFLLKISEEAEVVADTADVKIIGVPFYNSDSEAKDHTIETILRSL